MFWNDILCGAIFRLYGTPDPDRLTIASVHLDKNLVPWFQMMQRSHPFHSWSEFTRALELDFRPSIYECPRATLFKLSRSGSVADYYLQFSSLANRVYGFSNDALIDSCISGLSPEICRDKMIHSPISIVKVVFLAKVYEEKYAVNTKPHKFTSSNTYNHRAPFNSNKLEKTNPINILQTPPTRPMNHNQRNLNIKLISPTEMQLQREKGLCYWCDDQFLLNHKCPNHQIMMLQFDDTEEDTNPEPERTQLARTNPEPDLTTDDHHLSLNAMKGTNNTGILRFTGQIGQISVQVLVDRGSSHNFLQPRIIEFLKLPVEPGPGFKVLVGNGQSMNVEGVVPNLSITLQGHELTVSVFLLPVAGADMILGSSWLATLGPHVADYAALALKFLYKGKF